jgi:Ca2+/H+ antiporter, TMEM165/GDT1 family
MPRRKRDRLGWTQRLPRSLRGLGITPLQGRISTSRFHSTGGSSFRSWRRLVCRCEPRYRVRASTMDLSLLASVYAIIFLAELPDKTALALFLATRHRPLPVFLGASLALTIQSVVAVAFGHLLSLLPAQPVHIVAGVLFVGCAVAMWRRTTVTEEEADSTAPRSFFSVFATVFTVVFIAEWGDLTQIGTAALAARYHAPLIVLPVRLWLFGR